MSLKQILSQRPDLWRGRGVPAAAPAGIPTGFAALDRVLAWRGWPPGSLSEILSDQPGAALALLLPMLIELSRQPRWLLLVGPPLIPYAPALAARGLDLTRLVVVQAGEETPWAMEQGLRGGACTAVLGWGADRSGQGDWRGTRLRRLQLAAAAGDALALLVRGPRAVEQPSPAALRLAVQAAGLDLAVTLLKQRGGQPGSKLTLTPPCDGPLPCSGAPGVEGRGPLSAAAPTIGARPLALGPVPSRERPDLRQTRGIHKGLSSSSDLEV